MSTALSDDGSRIIGETVQIHDAYQNPKHETQEDFDDYYDIDRTVDIINKHGYVRVALQFPDELLSDSVRVSYRLKEKWNKLKQVQSQPQIKTPQIEANTNVSDIEEIGLSDESKPTQTTTTKTQTNNDNNTLKLYVLGDTSYGSCCVDVVASEHVDSQFIVHYGNACLQSVKKPVYHVFGSDQDLDVDTCVSTIKEYAQSTPDIHTVVLYQLCYHHIIPKLKSLIPTVTFANVDESRILQLTYDPSPPVNDMIQIGNLQFQLPEGIQNYKFLYIGHDTSPITNMMLDNNSKTFVRYSTDSNSLDDGSSETSRISRTLKRRYYLMHLAKEAQVIGIVVATTSATNYLLMIQKVKDLILSAGKKFYVFFVGKINVPKLANFSEIDLFVLISCPQNALIDSKDFLKPIVTPFELQTALLGKEKQWTGEYVSDFSRLLDSTDDANRCDDEDGDDYDYSFITGGVKMFNKAATSQSVQEQSGNALVSVDSSQRQIALAEMSPAMSHLQNRTYRGLDTEYTPPVSVMIEGRSGIASGYQDEPIKKN
ncbi:diphthamide biosynthesis protein [Acrasis kona]|uniref:2-(3-amino-3-carboxypropyl)histidine synthase subunit 2 n=1 Tax=Acrasis kona TaxID=1008807 RepID=A0AAW2YHV0_9EUKA